MAARKKEVSKYQEIRPLITPDHPGVISYQRMIKADGTRSKEYPLWQTTIRGEKISRRITQEDARKIQKLIDAAKAKENRERLNDLELVDVHRTAVERLREKTKKLRSERMSEYNKEHNKEANKKKIAKKKDREGIYYQHGKYKGKNKKETKKDSK